MCFSSSPPPLNTATFCERSYSKLSTTKVIITELLTAGSMLIYSGWPPVSRNVSISHVLGSFSMSFRTSASCFSMSLLWPYAKSSNSSGGKIFDTGNVLLLIPDSLYSCWSSTMYSLTSTSFSASVSSSNSWITTPSLISNDLLFPVECGDTRRSLRLCTFDEAYLYCLWYKCDLRVLIW